MKTLTFEITLPENTTDAVLVGLDAWIDTQFEQPDSRYGTGYNDALLDVKNKIAQFLE